jgi:hypothetical protein
MTEPAETGSLLERCGRTLRRHINQEKHLLPGAALAGCGYGLTQAAPRAENGDVALGISAAGILALFIGIAMIWSAWRRHKREERKPESLNQS